MRARTENSTDVLRTRAVGESRGSRSAFVRRVACAIERVPPRENRHLFRMRARERVAIVAPSTYKVELDSAVSAGKQSGF